MAKKKPAPAKEPDLLQQLRDGIERARRNDDTWEKMDGGEITPMKLAIAMVLWPESKYLRQAGITSPHLSKVAISSELWAEVKKVNYERKVAEIEELVRDAEDGNKITRRRKWIEAVLSDEVPKPPAGECSECRTPLGSNACFCAACHDSNELWRAIVEVRSKRNNLRGELKQVLIKHKVPLMYLDRIARFPYLASIFQEVAMATQARIKDLKAGGRNLKAVKGLRLALQQSDELKNIFRRNEVAATDLVEKFHRIEVDLATEIARASVSTVAMQSYLEFLSISQTSGAPVKADGRQRDVVIDGMFSIWKECKGKAPAANPSAHKKTPFVKLLEDIFPALERKSWVTGLEKAAIRVRRERVAKCKLAEVRCRLLTLVRARKHTL